MSTLIITSIYGGMDINQTPFLQSLQAVGYDGDLRIMQEEKYIGNRRRMYSYRQALQEAAPQVDTVILTDARDVIFQQNPVRIPHGEVDIYLEDQTKTLGNCPINKQNFCDEYGEAEFMKVMHRPVSCAGVVIGTSAGIARYLEVFCTEVAARRQDVPWSQPLHNYLLWNGRFDPVAINENEKGPVYTVGHCAEIRVGNHKIMNRAGEIPFMVHQFDRHLNSL